jgi:hypothetical protein
MNSIAVVVAALAVLVACWLWERCDCLRDALRAADGRYEQMLFMLATCKDRGVRREARRELRRRGHLPPVPDAEIEAALVERDQEEEEDEE